MWRPNANRAVQKNREASAAKVRARPSLYMGSSCCCSERAAAYVTAMRSADPDGCRCLVLEFTTVSSESLSSSKAAVMTAAGKLLLTIGTLVFFHAAYSTYEQLSLRKALGLVGPEANTMPLDITLETLVSFVVILLGIALTAAPLKNVTWASEMRSKSVDEVDSRSSFATLTHRGQVLFGGE